MASIGIRLALVGIVLAAPGPIPARAGGDPEGIEWIDDYKDALNRAGEARRPVMVEFWTSWCLYCAKLEKQTLGDPKVVELAEDFICARIDADVQKAAAARYTPPGYPTVVFATPSGAEIIKISGYREAEVFVRVMEAVREHGMALAEQLAVLDDDPKSFAARVAVGEIFMDLGLPDKAATYLKAAAKAKDVGPSEQARVQFLLSRAAIADGSYRKAIKTLEKLIAADPSGLRTPAYYLELGRAYALSGKRDQAGKTYAELARLFPESPEAELASNEGK
jgi:tetratricopeptide (TPR) repeat protein